MLFPTVTFAIFFLIVMPLNWLTMPRPPRWRLAMTAASYVFYGWWDWRFCLLLAGLTLYAWIMGRAIDGRRAIGARRLVLWIAVLGLLAPLAYFKYMDFFLSSAQSTLGVVGIGVHPSLIATVLPVGLSFYTFMALAYVIDIFRGTFQPTTLSRLALFLSFFPHLVAGPIVRPSELVPQFDERPDPRKVDATRGFWLIATGLFLKVVISSACAPIADHVFGTPELHSSLETLVAIYAYAIQIFADFAGYSTIAIGLALLLGFRFPDNFNSPYRALTLQDFWRRWHITLSRWLRDYVYIPLGGNRGGKNATYRNLFATMLIGGLWHGAGWTFVIWGGMHGVALAFERWRHKQREERGEPPEGTRPPIVHWLVTFNFVCLAWVFFRATSFDNAFAVLGRLFTAWGQPSPEVTVGVLAAIAVGLGGQFISPGLALRIQQRLSRMPYLWQGAALGIVLMIINTLGPKGVAPFIYFQF